MGLTSASGTVPVVQDSAGRTVVIRDALNNIVSGQPGVVIPPEPSAEPLFFPDHLSRWWDRMADGGQAVMAISGNSLVQGISAITDDGLTGTAAYEAHGWSTQVRDTLASRTGINTGVGLVRTGVATRVGSPQLLSSVGIAQSGCRLIGVDQYLEITLPASTRVWIHRYVQYGGTTDQPPSYILDGVPMGAGVSGEAESFPIDKFEGLANVPHTLRVVGPGTGRADISGFQARQDITGGFVIHRMQAAGGYVRSIFPTTGTPEVTARGRRLSLQELDVDLLVLAFGHNEMGAGQNFADPNKHTPASYAEELRQIVEYQAEVNGGCSVILAGPTRRLDSVTGPFNEQAFHDAAKAVAEANEHTAFLDFREVMGFEFDPAIMVDTVHPNYEGHVTMREIFLEWMVPA